jgi:hypothetical protein
VFHQLQRVRLEHFHRLDVDVAVGDHLAGSLGSARILSASNGTRLE